MRLTDKDALLAEITKHGEPEVWGADEYAQGLLDQYRLDVSTIEAAPTIGWISVNEQRPESGKHVLLCCEIRGLYSYKRRYQCIGFYAAKHSIPEGKYPEEADFYDYDEEEDEYYLQEGWYEVIHNWDEYSSVVIDDFVTHWMPLPEQPKEDGNG